MTLLCSVEGRVSSATWLEQAAHGAQFSCSERPEGTWRLQALTSGGQGGDRRESLWQGRRGPGWGGWKTCPPGPRQGTPRQETWATSEPSPQGQKNQHRQRVNKSALPGLRLVRGGQGGSVSWGVREEPLGGARAEGTGVLVWPLQGAGAAAHSPPSHAKGPRGLRAGSLPG